MLYSITTSHPSMSRMKITAHPHGGSLRGYRRDFSVSVTTSSQGCLVRSNQPVLKILVAFILATSEISDLKRLKFLREKKKLKAWDSQKGNIFPVRFVTCQTALQENPA